MSEIPNRIWVWTWQDGDGGRGQWEAQPGSGVPYVREEQTSSSAGTEAMRRALERAEAVMGRVLADTYWCTPDNTLWPDLCGAREEARSVLRADLAAPSPSTKALREALRPFARLADEVDRLRHEDDSTCLHRISAADLRRARAALAQLAPEGRESGEDATQSARRTYDEIAADIDAVAKVAPSGSGWTHRKSGGLYFVAVHAIREADMVPCIIYHPVEDDRVWFSRPADEFLDGRFVREPDQ